MKTHMKACVLAAAVPFLLVGEYSSDAPLRLTLAREAAAIVGAPVTPVSAAGVARRTTRHVVAVEATSAASAQQQQAVAQQQAATAQQQASVAQQQAAVAQQQAAAAPPAAVGTVVPALPAGCAQEAKGGTEYYKCGNTYYRAAFQGNNLVYVSAKP